MATFESIRNSNGMNAEEQSTSPVKIVIVGVGGGGSNAVDNMIEAHVNVDQFMAINTDRQALRISKAKKRVQIGSNITKGYGAGANPEKGRLAAEECRETLKGLINDMDLVFITAGMGGGTGTGAAPIVAEIAHSLGKLTIAFVTTPFKFEGEIRMRNAQMGIAKLREHVDSIIIVPNEKLATFAKDMTTQEAFKYADDILRQGVQALTDLIANPGRINVDFADIRTVLEQGGDSIMGIGRASGQNRAVDAVKKAVNNAVLDTSIEGATRAIVNVEGREIKMDEVSQAVELVRDICAPDANIIFGHAIVPALKDEIQVTIVATGFKKGGPSAPAQRTQQQPLIQPQNRGGYPVQQNPYGNQGGYPNNGGYQNGGYQNNGGYPIGNNGYPQQQQQPQQPQGVPQQQTFFNYPPQGTPQPQHPPRRNDGNGYVGLDDDSDTSWLSKLNKRK
ncbi:MAG: cell division protein FtsZ [Clostridiales bacterium]|nr:cell division protein FtsZ [Clostridiales bacterium]